LTLVMYCYLIIFVRNMTKYFLGIIEPNKRDI